MTKRISNIAIKLAAVIQILALTLLTSCSAVGVNASANVCHATGDAANPYEEITIDSPDLLNVHLAHAEDIYPVPEDGCPAVLVVPDADETAVCHATADAANPYDIVMVVSTDLEAYVLANPNDINPMPSTGCPTYLLEVNNGTVTFCHANDDGSKSYEEILVNVDGLDGHGDHEEDVFPISEADGCPASTVVVNDGRVTICHATSSKKNPYVKITVSENGLNGHGKHDGDIIPAPTGGCPTTKP